MSSKVSIIVPIYNASKYLEQCAESLVNQDYSNIEILLVDDGSTDNSGEICDSLQRDDDRIRVIHKENGGAASARNLGVKEATGDYVMFIDADDWFELDTVSTLVSHMDGNCLDVARFNYVREFGDRSVEKKNTFLEERVYEGEECKNLCRQVLGLVGKELSHPENMNFLASVCFNIYRRNILVDNGLSFTDIKLIGSFVDGSYNFEAFMYVKRFEFINRYFYHYRKTNSGAATANYRKNYVERQMIMLGGLEQIINKNDLGEDFKQAFVSRVMYNSMEMCFNALRGKEGFSKRYKEVKSILKHKELHATRREFKLSGLGVKWKIYFFFIKHRWTLPTYLMTSLVLKLKNRGV